MHPVVAGHDDRTPWTHRHERQVHLFRHRIGCRIKRVDPVERAELAGIAEQHVHLVGHQLQPLVTVTVNAQAVGECQRDGPACGPGNIHGKPDRLLGLLPVPEVTLAVEVRGGGDQVHVDRIGTQVGGHPEVGVHGALGIIGDLNEASGGCVTVGGTCSGDVETHPDRT